MYERFTERARQVIVLAQDEARGMRHSYIGSEHLLLGLLREQEGLAARVLDELGVDVEETRAYVKLVVGEGDVSAVGQIPFTPRAKKAQERALREALSMGHNYIGTEHLLLGLVREGGGVGVDYLESLGINADKIRNEIIRKLSGRQKQPAKDLVEPKSDATVLQRLTFAHACLRKAHEIVGEVVEELGR